MERKLKDPATIAAWERKCGDSINLAEPQTNSTSLKCPRTAFASLDAITSPAVSTAAAAYYLNRRPQTLRGWACSETWPKGLRPVRINGRLAWPVAGIKAILGVA